MRHNEEDSIRKRQKRKEEKEKNRGVIVENTRVTLENILVHPKYNLDAREGVYTVNCSTCKQKYVGET